MTNQKSYRVEVPDRDDAHKLITMISRRIASIACPAGEPRQSSEIEALAHMIGCLIRQSWDTDPASPRELHLSPDAKVMLDAVLADQAEAEEAVFSRAVAKAEAFAEGLDLPS